MEQEKDCGLAPLGSGWAKKFRAKNSAVPPQIGQPSDAAANAIINHTDCGMQTFSEEQLEHNWWRPLKQRAT
jgi:hypothetical protein